MLAVLPTTLRDHLQEATGVSDGPSGRVAFLQPFTGDLRLTLHVHALAPDGVPDPPDDAVSRPAVR